MEKIKCITMFTKQVIYGKIKPMVNRFCPNCNMEHTIEKNRKYCDMNCSRMSKITKKVDGSNVLKPKFQKQIDKKLNEPLPTCFEG